MQRIEISHEQKFYTTNELKALGLSYFLIRKLISDGILMKISKSTYVNRTYDGDESDFADLATMIPEGVICMLSAAQYYGLTTFRPEVIDVAIPAKKRISTLPVWPKTKLWYFNETRYSVGVSQNEKRTNQINIYDMEKTVADILCFRNKVGIEETREVLTNYLDRPDRDINQLCRYAKIMNCDKTLNTYLEVLI